MNNLLAQIFERKKWQPEKPTIQSFKQRFPNARNADWSQGETSDEVVFYQKKTEHLARYDKQGEYLLHKINLRVTDLPVDIATEIMKLGEIMNVIQIFQKDDSFQFEIIHRNENLIRFRSMVDHQGNVLETSKL